MKKLKKLVSILAAVAICILLPGINALTVSAEGPVTYYVKYVATYDDWRFQTGSEWNESGTYRELYYMYQDIKDGDIVIVDGSKDGSILDFPVRLSNLTIYMGGGAVVKAKSIDDCYILRDGWAAITGDVTNAYVYDNGVCTFNSNVNNLNVLNDPARNDSLLRANVTAVGTVNHLIGHDGAKLHYELYSFAAGKLNITNGDVKTDTAYYSTTAPAAGTQTEQSAQSTTTQTEQSAQSTTTQTSADEYDDVPKTGESNLILWLFGISAICLAGRYTLKKA